MQQCCLQKEEPTKKGFFKLVISSYLQIGILGGGERDDKWKGVPSLWGTSRASVPVSCKTCARSRAPGAKLGSRRSIGFRKRSRVRCGDPISAVALRKIG